MMDNWIMLDFPLPAKKTMRMHFINAPSLSFYYINDYIILQFPLIVP